MQDELIKGYMTRKFQEILWTGMAAAGSDPLKLARARVQACERVQLPVLAILGFEASRKGLQQSIQAFTPAMNGHPVIAEKNILMQYLISPDVQQEVAKRLGTAPVGIGRFRAQNPNPEDWRDDLDAGRVWQVVGGEDKGGIIVRLSESTSSPQLGQRISTGAKLLELELREERLKFEKLSGDGPDIGWVSIALKGSMLVQALY